MFILLFIFLARHSGLAHSPSPSFACKSGEGIPESIRFCDFLISSPVILGLSQNPCGFFENASRSLPPHPNRTIPYLGKAKAGHNVFHTLQGFNSTHWRPITGTCESTYRKCTLTFSVLDRFVISIFAMFSPSPHPVILNLFQNLYLFLFLRLRPRLHTLSYDNLSATLSLALLARGLLTNSFCPATTGFFVSITSSDSIPCPLALCIYCFTSRSSRL